MLRSARNQRISTKIQQPRRHLVQPGRSDVTLPDASQRSSRPYGTSAPVCPSPDHVVRKMSETTQAARPNRLSRFYQSFPGTIAASNPLAQPCQRQRPELVQYILRNSSVKGWAPSARRKSVVPHGDCRSNYSGSLVPLSSLQSRSAAVRCLPDPGEYQHVAPQDRYTGNFHREQGQPLTLKPQIRIFYVDTSSEATDASADPKVGQ
jgi:hypothetical protein